MGLGSGLGMWCPSVSHHNQAVMCRITASWGVAAWTFLSLAVTSSQLWRLKHSCFPTQILRRCVAWVGLGHCALGHWGIVHLLLADSTDQSIQTPCVLPILVGDRFAGAAPHSVA